MALAKANLGFPVVVSAGTTSSVYTVTASKSAYIRGIIICNTFSGSISTTIPQTVQIYAVPNGQSAGATNRIARITLTPDDTFFFDLQYPITLTTNGDSIRVFNEGSNATTISGLTASTNPVNVMVLGDIEL